MRPLSWKATIARLVIALLLLVLFPAFPAFASEYNEARPEDLTARNLRASSAIVIEQTSGQVLYEKNADEMRPPASTTKVLTALLALTMGNQDDLVTVSANAANMPEDASKIGLQAGEQVRLGDLIRATMVQSGNDGAIAIAEHLMGSEAAFVNLMNEAAMRYGCTRTHFTNSHGYHDDNHLSTARDLAIIAQEAMQNEEFREIARLTSFTLPETNLSKARRFNNRALAFLQESDDNKQYYRYATGIKTGQHSLAGDCFVGSAAKDGIQLISVVLNSGSTDKWRDTRRLMEYGFTQYESTSVAELYKENPKVINISSFALEDQDLGRLELNLRKIDPLANDALVAPKGSGDEQLKIYNTRTQIEYSRTLEAPVEAGEVMGTLTYTPLSPGAEPVVYELLASRSIIRRASLAPTLDEIRAYTAADPNPFPRFSLEFLIIILLPVIAVAVISQMLFKLFTRKRKPRVKQKLEYKTRYYR
ncbi:MAG TPA: D-alanyl-D-alanine carboxypeptidase family protein [Clostridia bacterium]|nr:D-alanyl-D-alanine carboxypeptidase family protein [Clostridia bacterium]